MKFVKSISGQNFQTPEVYPTTANESYTAGEGLVLRAGELIKAGATVKPTHIAAKTYAAPASGNEDLPVYPVVPHHVYETTFAVNALPIKEGDKVTLHSDGVQVTATAANGVATITKKLGAGVAGTKVYVQFI